MTDAGCGRIVDDHEEECPNAAAWRINDHGCSTWYCDEHMAEVTVTASMRIWHLQGGERIAPQNFDSRPRRVTAWQTPLKLTVRTPEGEVTASPGSWIVRGDHLDVWPIQDSIFHERYLPAPD